MKRFTVQIIKDGQIKLTVPHCELTPAGYPVHVDVTHPDYECEPDAKSEETGKLIPFVSKAACAAAGIDPKSVQVFTLDAQKPFIRFYLRMGMNPDGNEVIDWNAKEARETAEWKAKNPQHGPQPYRFVCEDCGDKVWSGTRCWETGLTHPGPDGSQMPEPPTDTERHEAALENACESGQIAGAAPADV